MRSNFEAMSVFFAQGLVPYQFSHALTCVAPAFILGIKLKNQLKWKKLLCWLALISSVVLVFISQSSGALLVMALSIVCSLFVGIRPIKYNMLILIIVFLLVAPLAISDALQLSFLQYTESVIGSEMHYQDKLEELESSIYGSEDEGDIAYRGNLLGQTTDAIISHPIFGVSDHSYGNHNALLDRWAEFGLIGFIPLIMLIFYFLRDTSKKIPENIRTFYYIGAGANILMMLSKSMFGWYQWFCFLVVLPVMIIFFGEQKSFNYNEI